MLLDLRGHTQQITAMTSYAYVRGGNTHTALITASSDRTLSVSSSADLCVCVCVYDCMLNLSLIRQQLWDPDTGHRVQNVSDLQSSVKVCACACLFLLCVHVFAHCVFLAVFAGVGPLGRVGLGGE